MDDRIQRRIDERRWRRRLFATILINTLDEHHQKLPANKDYVLSELLNAAADYVRQPLNITYTGYDMDLNFAREIERSFEQIDLASLDGAIAEGLRKLTHVHIAHCYPSGISIETELFDHYLDLCPRGMNKTLSPPYDLVLTVQEHEKTYTQRQLKDIKGIAAEMRPHIAKDLKHIGGYQGAW